MEWFGLLTYVLLTVAMVRLYGRLARRRRVVRPVYRVPTAEEWRNLQRQWTVTPTGRPR